MKTLLPVLLLGALTLLAPPADASSGHGRSRYRSSHVWVSGGTETVMRHVWVPGRIERVWVEPVFELRLGSCGERIRVCVASGYWRTIQHPGHYELRPVRVALPGRWEKRGSCSW
jgi:hypothetical protein